MEVELKIKNCLECPKHKVVADPDPSDWFCDDDEAIVCTALVNDEKGRFNSVAYNGQYKVVSSGLRPYETKKYARIPDFCPLIVKSVDPVTGQEV